MLLDGLLDSRILPLVLPLVVLGSGEAEARPNPTSFPRLGFGLGGGLQLRLSLVFMFIRVGILQDSSFLCLGLLRLFGVVGELVLVVVVVEVDVEGVMPGCFLKVSLSLLVPTPLDGSKLSLPFSSFSSSFSIPTVP